MHTQNTRALIAWAALVIAVLYPLRTAYSQQVLSTVDLRPHFTQGRTTRYHVWTQRQQTQSVTLGSRSQEFETSFEIEGEVTWTVKQVRQDGSALCLMKTDWLTATITGPEGESQRCDSRKANGRPEPLHSLLRALAGVPIQIEVANDGSIINATGIDQVKRKAPKDIDIPDATDFMESANDLATLAKAPTAAAISDSWNAKFIWNHRLGKMHQSMRYTLHGVEDIEGIPIATVNGVARMEMKLDHNRLKTQAGQSAQTRARMTDASLETQVLFDLQRHEAIGRNTTEYHRIEISMQLSQQTVKRTIDEYIHSQTLRIDEQ